MPRLQKDIIQKKARSNPLRKTWNRAKTWGKRLMFAGLLKAPLPAAIIQGCDDAKKEQKYDPLENGTWIEPYEGGILKDENGNYYMADRLIIQFREKTDKEAVEALTKEFSGRVTGYIPNLNAYELELNDLDAAIAALKGRYGVELASRNYYFKAAGDWDNEDYISQEKAFYHLLKWHRKIKLTEGLDLLEESGTKLKPTTIAVLDTGFRDNDDIPYVRKKYHWDFGDWDSDVNGESQELYGHELFTWIHGDMVSSFLASRNDGKKINGVASTKNNDGTFSILPIKMIPHRRDPIEAISDLGIILTTNDYRLSAALDHIIGLATELNIKVINMSFEYSNIIADINSCSNRLLSSKFSNLSSVNGGIIAVSAAGNYNEPVCLQSPQCFPNVIAVGATQIIGEGDDETEIRWENSNYPLLDMCMDLSAPGAGFFAFDELDSPWPVDGTSFAAPQVAGLVALMKSINPNLTFEETLRILRENADDIVLDDDPNPLVKGQTWKRINVLKTMQAMLSVENDCRLIKSYERGVGGHSDIYENTVVFHDNGKGQYADIVTNEIKIIPGTEECGPSEPCKIWGDKIVFKCGGSSCDGICLYEIGGSSIDFIGPGKSPDIQGNKVSYIGETENGEPLLKLYDIETGSVQENSIPDNLLFSSLDIPVDMEATALYGSKVITQLHYREPSGWVIELALVDFDDGSFNIIDAYSQNKGYSSSIYGNRVVFDTTRGYSYSGALMEYDIPSGSTRTLTPDFSFAISPHLWENKVVFHGSDSGKEALFILDLEEGSHEIVKTFTSSYRPFFPAIFGNNVVYNTVVSTIGVHVCTMIGR